MRPRKIIAVSIKKDLVVCIAEFRKRVLVGASFEYPETREDIVALFKKHRYAVMVVVRKQAWPKNYWRNFIANGARWLGIVDGLAAHWRIPVLEVHGSTLRVLESNLVEDIFQMSGDVAYDDLLEAAHMAVWGKLELGNRNKLSTKTD